MSRFFTAFAAVFTWSTPGWFRYCAAICLVSEALRGRDEERLGQVRRGDRVDQVGLVADPRSA